MGAKTPKTPKTPDRRIVRTRRLLRDALVSLILERGWDAVTVLEVCDRADVGRSTFYAHFGDKEDLLVSGFDELKRSLHAERLAAAGGFAFAEPLIEHALENQRLFRAVVGKRSGQTVQRRFREVVVNLVEADVESARLEPAQRDVVVRYVAGGFVELLTWWLDRPGTMKPAELAKRFRDLTSGALAGAR
jgi:AcrR family transcriptional regulator